MIPNYKIHALSLIKGIGPSRIYKICNACKNVKSLKDLTYDKLKNISGITQSVIKKINSIKFEKSIEEIKSHKNSGINYLTPFDEDYPKLLKSIYNPPVGIFVRGDIQFEKLIAIVGSRNITQYGKKITKLITDELVKNGFAIVSGFARGVDSLAHQTTLDLNGNTIAVLANGLDICYPPENKILYKKMWDEGSFISEYPMKHKPEAMYFPRRNRIISGLSLGTIVVEAGEKSGAIITAYNALEQNRDVFAVPGRIDSKQSIGCNKLIKEGAKPVLSVDVILESYQFNSENIAKKQLEIIPDLSDMESKIYKNLSHDPIHIDELVKKKWNSRTSHFINITSTRIKRCNSPTSW